METDAAAGELMTVPLRVRRPGTIDLERAILALRDPSWLGRPTDGPPERRHLRRIAAGVRNGRLLIVPDSAHLVNDEQPTIVNRSLIAHLTDGLTPGGDKKVG